jgi:hypothetical protein
LPNWTVYAHGGEPIIVPLFLLIPFGWAFIIFNGVGIIIATLFIRGKKIELRKVVKFNVILLGAIYAVMVAILEIFFFIKAA